MSLNFHRISHHYGALKALDEISLDVAPGEIICLFGPSGCGKTTLLRVGAGLEPLQSGSVSLDGEILANAQGAMPVEQRPVGFVFQDYVLFPHMTAAENIAFGLPHLSRLERTARTETELAAVGLAGLGGRRPHELSGGQQQRVALARAFARRPRAMLLDEPFASIDSVLRRQLRSDVRKILKAHAVPAVLVTHDPEEALAIGDRIAVMGQGRLIEVASTEDLYRSPASPEGARIFPGAQEFYCSVSDGKLSAGFCEPVAVDHPDGLYNAVVHGGGLHARLDETGNAVVVDCRSNGPHWTVTAAFLTRSPQQSEQTIEGASAQQLPPGAKISVDLDARLTRLFPRP